MSRPLPQLPVAEALPRLRQALAADGQAVLAAPPGSGKTTLVPLALLDEPWLAGKRILMLEPRRIAARASAARMAWLLGEKVGETVGYQIRFERKVSAATRIEVITEGLLTRRLQADPELPGVGLVIFDEFHERSLDADLALALTLDARANLNPELRLLVMSATLDTLRVSELLGRFSGHSSVIPAGEWRGSSDRDVYKPAQIVESAGQLYPIDLRYAPPRPDSGVDAAVADTALKALAETEGDILAFLPGGREIRGAQRQLQARLGDRVHLFPLYGDLSSAEQDAALQPATDGRRKIILATNIAQTSLTVEGVRTVVDGGYARVARFDLGAGANRLETLRVSRASADQRAGRAGRLGPGVAYRLWSRDQHAMLPAHDTPEILAADLSRLALELASWGADPAQLGLLDPPAAASWDYARELLAALGAVDVQGRVTPHGRELGRLPTAPRLGHMLLSAKPLRLAGLAAWVAAVLDERENGSDLEQLVKQFRSGRAEPGAQRRVREAVRQFLRLAGIDDEGGGEDGAGRLVALAFPERIARKRAEQNTAQRGGRDVVFLCADGGEARLPQADALAHSEWLAIAHWDPGTPRRVRLAAALAEGEVLRDQQARIVACNDVRWDPQSETVVAERQRRLGGIVLERKPLREGAGEAIRAAMLQGVAGLGLQVLPWSEGARQWQARVLSLRSWRPDDGWPDVGDAALASTLEEWLAPHLDGVTRRDHLARLDLASILNNQLDYSLQQKLARLAPTHLAVPSGSHIAIEYSADGAPPVLAVKLQELFGLTQTPAVNEGRNRVALHLLSPARRPIQVTQDLAGFWARTYPEVKKELKGRYPKHPWPDDPLAAPATARAKPRGT